jgi:hypothetical protein
MECNEAYWLKDCKDLNQHFADSGSNKCQWTCENGCEAATGDAVTAHFPYAHCEACLPIEQSPPNRVLCNDRCDVCMISADVGKYTDYKAGALIMKGRKGDPWVENLYDSVMDDADKIDELRAQCESEFGCWGFVQGHDDTEDVTDGSNFLETACKEFGMNGQGLYYYSGTGFDDDLNVASYEGGPAWRLAGLHKGELDDAGDGDYIGGHDYMDYLDYEELYDDFPWITHNFDLSSSKISFMNNGADCSGVTGGDLHACDWESFNEPDFEYAHEAQALVCCKTAEQCAIDQDLDDLFHSDVFTDGSCKECS